VKLGKNPGGGCAARSTRACTGGSNVAVTAANGSADFGILPKGSYTVTASGAGASGVAISVAGAAATKTSGSGAAPASATFDADGVHDITVTVVGNTRALMSPAKVKSHSNTNNN